MMTEKTLSAFLKKTKLPPFYKEATVFLIKRTELSFRINSEFN